MKTSTTLRLPAARVNKVPGLALRLATVLLPVCSGFFCFGQDQANVQSSEARSILHEVAQLATQVENLRDRMVVYVHLGLANWQSGDQAYGKGNFEDALKLIDDFPPQESFSDFYRQSIAEVQTELGEFEAAHLTLSRIKDASPQRSEAFRTVGLAQARMGDFEGAILNAPFIEDRENREEFLQTISKMQSETKTPHGSPGPEDPDEDDPCPDIAAADAIVVPDDRAVCLAYWGGKLATEDQFNAALETLRRAHQESFLATDAYIKASSLEEIARGQARAGSMGEATQSLAEAESIALAQGWSAHLEPVVELKVEWGDFDGADTTLAKVGDNEKINALVRVASAVVKHGDKKKAFAWANHQVSPRDRAFALIGIANAILGRQRVAILR